MRLYLSSYKIGDEPVKLKNLLSPVNKKIGYIPNAFDFSTVNPEKKKKHMDEDMQSLADIGLEVELLDLREYFGKEKELRSKISTLGAVWVSGGNVFVLRQAMFLSGLDTILLELKDRKEFVYGGYSAAGCVLSPTLDGYQIVDDATVTPYPELKNILWDGLNLIPFAFLPHFDSDHPESADIAKEIEYCRENDIPFKTLKDGDVMIIEG